MKNKKNDAVIKLKYDVAVIGSGSGGISAAVAASREGAKVVVVERNGYVGGMTTAGIPYLGYLSADRKPIVGGIATEFVDELKKDGASYGVRYCPKHISTVAIDPEKVKLTGHRFLIENGVDVMLHTTLTDAVVKDGRITTAVCECAGTRIEIEAKIFVDSTGDGTLAYLAGAEYEKGTAGVDLQPPSVLFTIGGVNKERFFEYLERTGDYIEPYTMEYLREGPNFVLVTLQELWKKLNPLGEWPMGIWAMIYVNRFNDSEICVNGPRMASTDATDPFSVTKAEVEGQKQAFAFVEMLRKYVDGFEKAFVSHINDSICVRETRRIVGVETLSVDELVNGNVDERTVALGAYPIDIHSSKDNTSEFYHLDKPYGIPYLTTCCKTVKGLMMSGRCISVDSKAYGSTRVMGTCFAVAEAVGIGAAIAAREGIEPKEVDVSVIREKLIDDGAVLKI